MELTSRYPNRPKQGSPRIDICLYHHLIFQQGHKSNSVEKRHHLLNKVLEQLHIHMQKKEIYYTSPHKQKLTQNTSLK